MKLLKQSSVERFGKLWEDGGEEAYRYCGSLMDRYEATSQTLSAKPALSWSHVAELAEIAWFLAPKEEKLAKIGPGLDYYTGRLSRDGRDAWGRHRFAGGHSITANAALIEAVLTLSGGQRYDYRFVDRSEGWWLDCPDWVDAISIWRAVISGGRRDERSPPRAPALNVGGRNRGKRRALQFREGK